MHSVSSIAVSELLSRWSTRFTQALETLEERSAEVERLGVVRGPEPRLLSDAEAQLGRRLPTPLEELFTVLVAFRGSWRLESELNHALPKASSEVEWGGVELSVHEVIAAEESRRDWVKECFPDRNDPYDVVWHDKFAFMTVPNGDCIALSEAEPECPVYYLSHDDGEGHGVRLASSVLGFLDEWSKLAFAGPEDWLLLPFRTDLGLDASSLVAHESRHALALEFLANDQPPQ